MLQQLHISNYALIESLSVDFSEGFSVITGETGAGKSILLGALGFVLGDRADTNVLYDKDKKCVVEASFSLNNDSLKPLFEENDLDFETECSFRRELSPTKKTRAFINARFVADDERNRESACRHPLAARLSPTHRCQLPIAAFGRNRARPRNLIIL